MECLRECRETYAFRGPPGMARGQRWPAGDALLVEEAILRNDPRVQGKTLVNFAESWRRATASSLLLSKLNETLMNQIHQVEMENRTGDQGAAFWKEKISERYPGGVLTLTGNHSVCTHTSTLPLACG